MIQIIQQVSGRFSFWTQVLSVIQGFCDGTALPQNSLFRDTADLFYFITYFSLK